MNLPSIYTNKWLGIDKNYWKLLLVLLACSLLAFGFRKTIIPYCSLVTIVQVGQYSSNANTLHTYRLDEKVSFSLASMYKGKKQWYVGNDLVSDNDTFYHVFKQSGRFVVKLILDGNCTYYSLVQILPYKHTPQVLTADNIVEANLVIEGPESFDIGSVTYFTTALQANAYEWSIKDRAEYGIKTEATVGYSFMEPGQYTLQLVLNNDASKPYTKLLTVKAPQMASLDAGIMDVPKPLDMSGKDGGTAPKQVEEPPKVNEVKHILPDAELLALFKLIRDEKKQMSDLLSSMCKGAQTKVLANDDKVMTLEELCHLLQSKKWALGRKPKVNSISTVRSTDGDNCVSVIYIKYK